MLLALKLTITPLAVALVTVAARRRGPRSGGWLAAVPYTSAPVVAFLTAGRGGAFGSLAALGVLAGTASQAAFALAYALVASRLPWPAALGAAVAAFAAATIGLDGLTLTISSALAIVLGAIVLALALMPRAGDRRPEPDPPGSLPPAVDAVARAAVATGAVLLLTALAPRIGPTLTGLVSPFPVFGAIFMVFPHRALGSAAAVDAARGLVLGLFACAAFFAVLAASVSGTDLVLAYLLALAVLLIVQGIVIAFTRWSRVLRPGRPSG